MQEAITSEYMIPGKKPVLYPSSFSGEKLLKRTMA